MAQLVHDLAPGAALAFATSGPTAEAMADNIRALRAAGSTVIVDDITFFDEPMYQDGPISIAVNEVVAAGVPYYSSAANSNVISQFPGRPGPGRPEHRLLRGPDASAAPAPASGRAPTA